MLCPESLLKKTRNAASMVKTAEAEGWDVVATYAIGWNYPDDGSAVKSIMVRCSRGSARLTGLWRGPIDAESLGFDGGWEVTPLAQHRKVGWNDIGPILKGTKRKPTPKQDQIMASDAAAMMEAINVLSMIGVPIKVLKTGTSSPACKGKVKVGLHWWPCAGVADEQGVLCAEGCETGLLV